MVDRISNEYSYCQRFDRFMNGAGIFSFLNPKWMGLFILPFLYCTVVYALNLSSRL